MKSVSSTYPRMLFLLLGAFVPMHARQEHGRENRGQDHAQQPAPSRQEHPAERQPENQSHRQIGQSHNEGRREPQAPGVSHEERRQQQSDQGRGQRQERRNHRSDPQPSGREGRAQQSRDRDMRRQQPFQDRAHRDHPRNQGGERLSQESKRNAWQGRRATHWQSEHRRWSERGGYRGYHIPEQRYHSYFGPDHTFRLFSYPMVVVGGLPQFQYGGMWLSFVDPWPEYWSATWYDDDDVYVQYYEDGYYLYNRRYPEDRISISVNLN